MFNLSISNDNPRDMVKYLKVDDYIATLEDIDNLIRNEVKYGKCSEVSMMELLEHIRDNIAKALE